MHQNEKVLRTGLCAHLAPGGASGATCHPWRTPRHTGGPSTEWMSCLLHRGGTPLGQLSLDIIGNSELGWTGMGEFNLDDHYIYYCGQESLEEME